MEGTPFGRYRLLALLGRGGMGEVWRAYDTETDRIVAVKVLPEDFIHDKTFQQRFRREAHAAAGLNEPHVVPIHHYGEIDGRLYVDMRLIEGRDLESLLGDGPLQAARAVTIVEQVAWALQAAHRVGLVHRDVKPSNILIAENDFAYLIDFGIARAAGQTGLTSTGAAIGTWAYMAPERFSTGQADARSDVYALACVLHESLTGQRPYPGDSLEQQVAAHLMTPPPQPSALRGGIPRDLDTVVATGMAKNPDERYQSTKELAQAARAGLTRPTPLAPPIQPPRRANLHFSPTVTDPNAVGLPTQRRPATTPTPPRLQVPLGESTSDTPQAGRTRRWSKGRVVTVSAAVGAVALVVAVTTILMSRTDTKPAGSQADQPSTSSLPAQPLPTTTTAKPLPDINTLLLSTGEINTVLGTTELAITQTGDAPDDAAVVSPPECHAAQHVNDVTEYANTGFIAMRWQILDKPFPGRVIQSVTQFTSPESANKFVVDLTPVLESCRGKTLSDTPKEPGTETQNVVDTVAAGPNVVSVTTRLVNRPDLPPVSCEHVFQSASSFVIDIMACDSNISDQATRIASMIAAKIDAA